MADTLAGRIAFLLGGAPVAPLLMVGLGFFLARSRRPVRALLLRGLRLLLGGLALNLALNAHLLLRIGFGLLDLDPWRYLLGVDILPFAGLAVLLLAPLCRLPARVLRLLAPLLALLTVCARPGVDAGIVAAVGRTADAPHALAPLPVYLYACVGGESAWSYFPLFPWLAYPLLGVALAQIELPACLRGRAACALAFAAAVAGAPFGSAVSADLPRYYHHGLAFLAWSVAALAALALAAQGAAPWAARVLAPDSPDSPDSSGAAAARRPGRRVRSAALRGWCWMGRRLTALYVAQWLILGNAATLYYRKCSLAEVCAGFAAALGASCLLVAAWDRADFTVEWAGRPVWRKPAIAGRQTPSIR